MIEIACPNCSAPLSIDSKYAGQTGTCKHCGGKIVVPEAGLPVFDSAAEAPESATAAKRGGKEEPGAGAYLGGCVLMALLIFLPSWWLNSKLSCPDESELRAAEVRQEAQARQLSTAIARGGNAARSALLQTLGEVVGADNLILNEIVMPTTPEGRLAVSFKMAENLTLGMTVRGMKMDIRDILRVVKDSGLECSSVFIRVYAPLQDAFGNSSLEEVAKGVYSRETFQRINYKTVALEQVAALAENGGLWIHRALQQ